MSTRCFIAMSKDDINYQSIYCHHAGYDSGNGVGPTLRQYHNSEYHAESLIALGDISYVQGESVCAYHRDRGDAWEQTKPRLTSSKQELIALAIACDADYLYIYEAQHWSTQKLRS
jgi:hypothetical protein